MKTNQSEQLLLGVLVKWVAIPQIMLKQWLKITFQDYFWIYIVILAALKISKKKLRKP